MGTIRSGPGNYRIIEDYDIPVNRPSNPPSGMVRLFVDPATGQLTAIDSNGNPALASGGNLRSLQFVLNGQGATPGTGVFGQISIPYACTIKGWVITADQVGSAVVDILRSTFAAFPSTSSIAGTDKPTLSSAQKNQDQALSGWGNTAINAGDIIQANLNSVTTVTQVFVTLTVSVP